LIRIGYGLLLVLVASAALVAAPASGQPARVPRIGYVHLSPLSPDPSPERGAFLDGLRELGHVPGKTILIEYRSASLNLELLDDAIRELVDLKVDVIVAVGTQAAHVAQGVTKTVPIVFPAVADPVGVGLVASLARPGGNATGQAIMSPELGGKRLALLKEAFPRISRVAVFLDADNPGAQLEWKETESAARALGLAVRPVEMRRAQDLDQALAKAARERPDALMAIGGPLTSSFRLFIIEFAAKQRLPAIYGFREFTDSGGLIFYGANLLDSFRRAAVQVDRILKGAKPVDLPVEQPTKFELVVNLKTARQLKLTIPQAFLLRADRVIE
jgi:putative ABC transport system substrate-binding protein